jgi:hypothetical protein
VSREISEHVYGVTLNADGKSANVAATEARRGQMRESRKQNATPVSGKTSGVETAASNGWQTLLRFHAVLEISGRGTERAIRCNRCGHLFCSADENYKLYALHRAVHLSNLMPPLPTGEPYIGEYHEYFCPGCATQLQVDMFSPSLGGDAVLWDTRIDASRLKPVRAKRRKES